MCGIVAYIGDENPLPIIIEGLQRLEYRGYDSAGIFLSNKSENSTTKVAAKVEDLKLEIEKKQNFKATVGMGHTRWATHGVPNQENAHPHLSNSGDLFIVHNGIIENYDVLKKELIKRGYTFYSETDSEVLINLIEETQKQEQVPQKDYAKIKQILKQLYASNPQKFQEFLMKIKDKLPPEVMYESR